MSSLKINITPDGSYLAIPKKLVDGSLIDSYIAQTTTNFSVLAIAGFNAPEQLHHAMLSMDVNIDIISNRDKMEILTRMSKCRPTFAVYTELEGCMGLHEFKTQCMQASKEGSKIIFIQPE